jgi:hypothetical protein
MLKFLESAIAKATTNKLSAATAQAASAVTPTLSSSSVVAISTGASSSSSAREVDLSARLAATKLNQGPRTTSQTVIQDSRALLAQSDLSTKRGFTTPVANVALRHQLGSLKSQLERLNSPILTEDIEGQVFLERSIRTMCDPGLLSGIKAQVVSEGVIKALPEVHSHFFHPLHDTGFLYQGVDRTLSLVPGSASPWTPVCMVGKASDEPLLYLLLFTSTARYPSPFILVNFLLYMCHNF